MKKAEAVAKNTKKSKGFSAEERTKKMKAEARTKNDWEAGKKVLLAKIAEMQKPYRSMATPIHEIVKESAPSLWAKTWYGQLC